MCEMLDDSLSKMSLSLDKVQGCDRNAPGIYFIVIPFSSLRTKIFVLYLFR